MTSRFLLCTNHCCPSAQHTPSSDLCDIPLIRGVSRWIASHCYPAWIMYYNIADQVCQECTLYTVADSTVYAMLEKGTGLGRDRTPSRAAWSGSPSEGVPVLPLMRMKEIPMSRESGMDFVLGPFDMPGDWARSATSAVSASFPNRLIRQTIRRHRAKTGRNQGRYQKYQGQCVCLAPPALPPDSSWRKTPFRSL